MQNTYSVRNQLGASLIELTVAMFISTVVITGVYQLYRFISISTTREKQKSELQRDIITVSSIIERDIRMAGCNLPGNGFVSLLDNTGDERLSLYINEHGCMTTLSIQAESTDSLLHINDTIGFKTNGYVCIASPIDTIFRTIIGIGVDPAGSDTLYLSSKLGTGSFTIAATGVFPATRMCYRISGSPVPKLYRVRNAAATPIGGHIDSINIIPKNTAGTAIGSATDLAAVITILVGGHVGNADNRVFIGDSVEVNIRN